MPTFQPVYNGQVNNSGVASPGRGLTPACHLGIDYSAKDPSLGIAHIEDFLMLPNSVLTQATSGTAALATDEDGGVLLIDTAAATADQGPTVQFPGLGFTPVAGDIVCFETRLKVSDAATAPNIVFGLCANSTAPIAAGALTDLDDYAYFHSIGGASAALKVTFAIEDGTADSLADIHTLVDGTYAKFGFRCVVDESIDVFVNGVKYSSNDLSVAAFPDGWLCPIFAIEGEGTVDPILHVDWFAVGCTGTN